MRLAWLGHSTVLVEAGGARVLADPLLRNRVGGLRRTVPLPARAAALLDEGVDAVVLSHLHHDHCDLPTLRRLPARHLLVPPGAAAFLAAHGVPGAVELAPGERAEVAPGVEVTAVPAEHDGRREPFGPRASSVGHLVETASATAWLAGDTGLFDALAGLPGHGRRGVVDVAAVPVWGWGPNLGPGHLDPTAAAEAVARVAAAQAVPVHWGTLHPAGLARVMREQLTTPGPRFAEAAASAAPATRVHVLAVGGTLDLS